MQGGLENLKRIIVRATGFVNWVGGLYYTRNVAYQLYRNDNLRSRLHVIVNAANFSIFDFLGSNHITIVENNNKRDNDKELFKLFMKYRGAYVFPSPRFNHIPKSLIKMMNVSPIMWIPDFQHNHLPELFPNEQYHARDEDYRYMIQSEYPIVLSSKDALSDLNTYYMDKRKNTYVMPFVSFIEKELLELTDEYINETLKKYNLCNSHFGCIMNQFWQHKNHIVVFEALKKYFLENPKSDFKYVFTGNLFDDRNPAYIKHIKQIFEDSILKEHLILLGFINRKEQLALMKKSEYVIQPSLFEGWGTVVEDAKVLDKTIILSDIPVHREQMNNKCILFPPNDSDALLKIIKSENKKLHTDNYIDGIEDMKRRAVTYSKNFEKLIYEMERIK